MLLWAEPLPSMILPMIGLNMIALSMTLFMNYCTADFLAHSLVIIDLNLGKLWVVRFVWTASCDSHDLFLASMVKLLCRVVRHYFSPFLSLHPHIAPTASNLITSYYISSHSCHSLLNSARTGPWTLRSLHRFCYPTQYNPSYPPVFPIAPAPGPHDLALYAI